MNLTSQYIVNPKSRDAYFNSKASYKSIRTTSTRLRLHDDRYILNLKEKDEFRVGKTKFKMIQCQRGVFKMGKDNILTKIEIPFLLGETEVTQDLFEKIMGYNPSGFQRNEYLDSNQRPVEKVTWYDAVMFCNRLSKRLGKRPYYNISIKKYVKEQVGTRKVNLPNIELAKVTINPQANGFRLPLEKEWEYAYKAGTNNLWAGTNNVNQVKEVAWFKDNSNNQTHPVKGKKPNEWGFYDMSGNVWEWCYDKYSSTLAEHVHQGGSWYNDASELSSDFRFCSLPDGRLISLGFRVSASLVN